ncbi:MAG: hypothetical protein SP1CHLAM54_04250 [Chlamydiia bacterium]|nr:hypothetical protein [Chlamydiia bacterium]MCH9615339.1 hypothetical protein [Chlamydiia bacterium]MCH9628339.1 hypothetical protein [Chlamydiia bacterium]
MAGIIGNQADNWMNWVNGEPARGGGLPAGVQSEPSQTVEKSEDEKQTKTPDLKKD